LRAGCATVNYPAMPRAITFADVPHEPAPWWERLLEPVVFGVNLTVAAFMYVPWRTARVRWAPPLDGLLARMARTNRPFILYTWHAFELLTLCTSKTLPSAMGLMGIGHDGIRSRMLQRTMTWYGGRIWVYRRHSPIAPRQQIVEMMRREGAHIAIVADAGGPYGQVKPGLAELARDTAAFLVPFAVRGRGVVWIRRPVRQGIPGPFARLEGLWGEPRDGRDATVSECKRWLTELDQESVAAE